MAERFNEPQKSRILAGVSYIDKLLIDIEQILTASSSQAFAKYKKPLTPAQVRVIRDYIKRLRQQVVRVLNDFEVALPEPKVDTTHAIRVTLQFIEIAMEELAPDRLNGYGKVPDNFCHLLAGGLQEMKGIVRQMDSYLIQPPDADAGLRLSRLSRTGDVGELLSVLTGVIDRHGFVEFRVPLSRLIEKIENPAYEIAFFGRVSAGKSSLLNRIIGADLLPTGVTPITAIPTQIRNQRTSGLLVWTADGRFERYAIDRLKDFVTEARNPGNDKRITRLIAGVPIPALPAEVVFVDTPGLGSLALEGASETLAYLPQCDLGVVLVDASSTVHADDIATLDALRAASVQSLLVLSKADLVSPQDLERLIEYTRDRVFEQLRTEINVAPLTSRADMSHFLDAWVTNEIAPRIANARRLAQESTQRKANNLANRVLHALQMSVKTADTRDANADEHALKSAESQLREAASLIESISEKCFRITGQIRADADDATTALVKNATEIWDRTDLNETWLQKAVNALAQYEAQELARAVQDVAHRLSEALETAAQVTFAGGRGEAPPLENLVNNLPAPDFSVSPIKLHRPQVASISIGLARRLLRQRIEKQCGSSLARFFNTYGRELELWFRNTLGAIEREFNSSADIYRAQMQRLTTEANRAEPDTTILEDISRLNRKLGTREAPDAIEARVTA